MYKWVLYYVIFVGRCVVLHCHRVSNSFIIAYSTYYSMSMLSIRWVRSAGRWRSTCTLSMRKTAMPCRPRSGSWLWCWRAAVSSTLSSTPSPRPWQDSTGAWLCTGVLSDYTLRNKGFQRGSLPVPIGEPFLVPGSILLVPCSTLLGSIKNPLHRGFYMETKKGSPVGTAEEPFWNPFF